MSGQVLNESRPVARKPHYCDHCVRVIPVGEKYHSQFVIFEGEATTWRSCQQCEWLLLHIWQTDRDAWDDDYGLDLAEYLNDTQSPFLKPFRAGWLNTSVESLEARVQRVRDEAGQGAE